MSDEHGLTGSRGHARKLTLRDSSEKGVDHELGSFHGIVVGAVTKVDDDKLSDEIRTGHLLPRNWHELELSKPLVEGGPYKDRRYDVSLVSDRNHAFKGFRLTSEDWTPYLNDWSGDQRSTRIVDYSDPKGRTALLVQALRVVDDHLGQYTAAIPMGRATFNDEDASSVAAGYLLDEGHGDQVGLLDTVFTTNSADTLAHGRESTPIGILGLRHDAHFEYDGTHGCIYFDLTDVSAYQIPTRGQRYKATMRADASARGATTELPNTESVEWRPWFQVPQFFQEGNPPTDGPVPVPGDGGTPTTGDGGTLVVSLSENPPLSTNGGIPEDGRFGGLAISDSGAGARDLWLWQPGSSAWAKVSGGGSSLSPCFYGDGSDGAGVADGATAIAGCTLAANVYTLTRDIQLTSLTVSNGVTVDTHGYRLLVAGTATINAGGVVSNNASQRLSTNFGSIANGGAGGTGISVSGNGNNSGTMNVSLGGAGGKGGNAGANTGANGMAANRPSAANGTYRAMPFAMLGYVINPNLTATWLSLNGGGGGGSGALAAGAANSSSGAGGGGAGMMVFTAKLLTNNGTISANGFAGANAVAGADGIAAGGGGGGGGGGLLLAGGAGSSFGTTQVNGGALGTGANGGANGVAGSVGTVVTLCG